MSGLLKLRIEPGDAGEFWKRAEGRIVEEKFPLLKYLSGSDDSALYLTSITVGPDAREAAIKLIYGGSVDVDKQLSRWRSAAELRHPNLLRVFDCGRCEFEGMQLLYVVQEYADENLAQIVPERTLTSVEAREVLPPILAALQYLHAQGFAHGQLEPANIQAIGDQVKLSSDGLVRLGEKNIRAKAGTIYDPPEAGSDAASAASDLWQLGVTLVEVLTQRLPAWDRAGSKSPEIPRAVPEPFREIAKHCLQPEPNQRWMVAQILNALTTPASASQGSESKLPALALVPSESFPGEGSQRKAVQRGAASTLPAAGSPGKTSAKRPYWLVVATVVAVLAVAIFLAVRAKAPAPASGLNAVQQPNASPVVEPSQTSQPPVQPGSGPTSTAKADGANAGASAGSPSDEIINRVTPDVSSVARRTIHGRIVVRVRVKVDAAGNVSKATLQSGPGSRYFSRIALESAQEWKFSPAAGESSERQWNLQFAFTRSKTEVSAAAMNR